MSGAGAGTGEGADAGDVDAYKPAPKVELGELLAKGSGDESLERYKKSLLGAAATAAVASGEMRGRRGASTSTSGLRARTI
jgi:hypothetical protein